MAHKAFDASGESGPGAKKRLGTPRDELEQLRKRGAEEEAQTRELIMEAMLAACGESGYRNVSVQNVLDRYGGYRLQFYRTFASKASCYEAAYIAEAERLSAALLGAGSGAGSWRSGLRAALKQLGRYACERPLVARGLLVEVHVAEGVALDKRKELLERLSRAVDRARRQTESRHYPPPLTAAFMISTIESAVCEALERSEPESFTAAVPELAHLIVAAYFGEEAAAEELSAAQAA